jgi:flagellar biosynthesis/type III secretory pathway protein FliH
MISSGPAGRFDKAIEVITKNKRTMGIREMVLERAKKEGLETGLKTGLKRGRLKGREEGLEEGLEKGIQKGKAEVVSNLIIKMAMTDAQAADIAGVSVDFVKKIRKKLKK